MNINDLEKRQGEYLDYIESGNVSVEMQVSNEFINFRGREEAIKFAEHQLTSKLAQRIVDKFSWDIQELDEGGITKYSLKLYIHTHSEMKKAVSLLKLWSKLVGSLHRQIKGKY